MKAGGLRSKGIFREVDGDAPLISIIMVTWNAEKHFRQALESVINQDYPNKEILIIDGGSTDATLRIVSEFESSIDYWLSEPDQGIYDAMNKGIRLSRGNWIGFKNADDWYAPGAISHLVACIIREPEVGLWYGNSYSVIQEHPLKVAPFFTKHQRLGASPGIDHRCSFVRADLHRKCLFNVQFRLAADLDVFWRLKESGVVFMHTGAFMAYKRFGGASDGTTILKESFRINARYAGYWYAIRSVAESRLRYFFWKAGNAVLRFFLGPEAYHRFKARKVNSG